LQKGENAFNGGKKEKTGKKRERARASHFAREEKCIHWKNKGMESERAKEPAYFISQKKRKNAFIAQRETFSESVSLQECVCV